jgi:hypothetical protein
MAILAGFEAAIAVLVMRWSISIGYEQAGLDKV